MCAVLHCESFRFFLIRVLSTSPYRRTRVYPKFRVSPAIAVLLALVPFAYLVRMVVLRYVDVPFWDAWELVPKLDRMHQGALTFQDFWGQHNEHRPMFPTAVLLGLARLTGWDTRWEIAVNVTLGAGIFSVYCAYLRTAWRAYGGAPLWLVPLFSALLFSTVQWENWIWGWQITVFLCAWCSALAAYLVSRGPRPGTLWGPIACGVVASYSFGSGLVLWPALAPGIWIAGGGKRALRLAAWIAAAAVTYASYFYGFQRPEQPSMLSNFTSLDAARAYAFYVCTQLGTSVAGDDLPRSALAGLLAVVAFAALAIRLRRLHADPVYLFPLLIGLQSIGTAMVSGLGRTWMGPEQAQSSRYTTLTLPLWCAIAMFAVLWRATAPATQPLRHRVMTAATVLALLAMLGSAFKTTRVGASLVFTKSEVLMYARRSLISGRGDTLLMQLYPVVDSVRERRAVLMRLHMAVFRPSAEPTYPSPGAE